MGLALIVLNSKNESGIRAVFVTNVHQVINQGTHNQGTLCIYIP